MSKELNAKRRRDPNVYPPAWNYRRTKAIADYYDSRKQEPLLSEPAVADAAVYQVWMEIPQDLVPEVRKLIARHRKTA